MDLKNWAFKHNEYLKLPDGVPILVRFISAEEFIDDKNEDREKVRYCFEVEGVEKTMESQSVGLAEQMGDYQPGDWCMICKTGTGRQTSYDVKKVEKGVNAEDDSSGSDEDFDKETGLEKPPTKKVKR